MLPSNNVAQYPLPADLVKGARLGKYEILRRLATGGMAEIFLARVSELHGVQKIVVCKRILPQLATQEDFVEMFLDEARIAATLQHPNIVQMYDVGMVQGNYFIAMEYLHGEDLRAISKTLAGRGEKLPLEIALTIVCGVASALHYAHEKVGFDGAPLEIVHRDVSPQNVIVTYDGNVKLLDFGIAKASNRFGQTRYGTLKGKVHYMSPEQCRSEPLDRRADVFSLGILLYELTTGQPLFAGGSDFEVLKRIVEGRIPPPSEVSPGYDRQLEGIVMRALEKERDDRLPTAQIMLQELEELVLEARLRVTASHMQHFMHHVFGAKIEAWRDAQAQGKSLGEHLEEVDDDDVVEELDERQAEAEERAARERAALRALIEQANARTEEGEAVPTQMWSRAAPLESPETDAPLPFGPSRAARIALIIASTVVFGLGVLAVYMTVNPRHPKYEGGATAPVATGAPVEKPAPTPPTRTKPEAVATPTTPATPPAANAASAMPSTEPLRASSSKRRPSRPRHDTPREPSGKPAETEPAPAVAASPPAPEPAGDGKLVLATTPWMDVSVDGESKGQTPLAFKLSAGTHKVVFTNPEFNISRTITVTVKPGETVKKRLEFPH